MEQLPALAPASAVPSLAPHQQPDRQPAEPAPAILAAAPHGHHGEVLHAQQARLDVVRSTFTGTACPLLQGLCVHLQMFQCLHSGV